jgi:hypothetical protein
VRNVQWVIFAALVVGIVFGYQREWLEAARARRETIDVLMSLALVFFCTLECSEIVRKGHDNRLLLACILIMVPFGPMLSRYRASLNGPLGVTVTISAYVIWLALLAACLNLKRRLALWCVWLAGAVAASGVLLHFVGLGGS